MLTRLPFLALLLGLALAASSPAAPALVYSTYLREGFTPNAIATDSAGNIYLAGGILIDPAAHQTTVFVAKLNPQATQYLYVRYLGGSVYETANAIAVDDAGNAYVAGQTASPDFPVTAGGNLGTPATGTDDRRSFVVKLDPSGNVVYSDLLGGSAQGAALAVAAAAGGQALVSGLSYSSGFPATPGAYSVSETGGRPYLLELDSAGTKLVFSATGIGGSALALDSRGDIYIAGTTNRPDYPTTPGVYQTQFPSFQTCLFPCQIVYQGSNQYVTKVDPTGSKLIYSTSLSGNGNTINEGLAVDEAGNVYVTGFQGGGYPYTVTPPEIPELRGALANFSGLPFLSKLDPAGRTLLFSVPAGGAGVQTGPTGTVYVGGRVGYSPGLGSSFAVTAKLPALASVPDQCLPNALQIRNSAYVSQADAVSGDILGTQFIGGSDLNPSGVILSGAKLWIAGATGDPGVPFAPNALLPDFGAPDFGSNLGGGAYLGAVDFTQPQPPEGTPQLGCLLDGADLSPVGPVSIYRVLTLFGSNLGPEAGISASDYETTNLGGVTVTIGGLPAILLYVSPAQINFAVPLTNRNPASMQVMVNGLASQPRILPVDSFNPHLFINNFETFLDIPANPNQFFISLAINGDGSVNGPANPVEPGSAVSVFVNGIAPDPEVNYAPLQLAAGGRWTVVNLEPLNPFIYRVELRAPPEFCGSAPSSCPAALPLSIYRAAIGSPFNPMVYIGKSTQ